MNSMLPEFGPQVDASASRWQFRPGVAWAAALVLLAAGAVSTLGLQAALSALLASAFYYLVPAGVGLLLLPDEARWKAARLTGAERLLLAYLVGLLAMALIYVIRERGLPASSGRDLVDWLVGLLAMAGWWRARSIMAPPHAAGPACRSALLALAVYLPGYLAQFYLYSRFPLTDLFQFTHILKGAEEFRRFDLLNPFTADSYVPAIQVSLGLAMKWAGAEALPTFWTLSLVSFGFRWGMLYVLARRLPGMAPAAGVLAALALPFWGVGVPTNGEIVAGGCCLAMALCVPAGDHAGWRRVLPLLLVVSVVPLSALLARGVPALGFAAVLLALLAGCMWGGRARATLALGLAAFVLVPMHRSAVLFLPLGAVVMVWLAMAQGRERLSRWGVRVLSLAVLVLAALVLLRWTGLAGVPDPGLMLSRLFDSLAGTNFTRDADSLMGISSKVALFEVARSVGPFLLLFGLAAAWRREPDPRFLPAQAAGVALFLLVMVGLPFGHRAAFLVVVLLAGVVAARLLEADASGRRRQGLAFVAFVVLMAIVEYSLPQASAAAASHVARGVPLVLACLAVAAAAMSWCLWTRNYGAVLLVVLFGTVVAERQIIHAHFMHYAYPDVPPEQSTPVSHYAREDIEAAGWLRGETRRVAVLSDPYTMAILRALDGANSIVTFSNLDTGRRQVRTQLHAYLHALIADDGAGGAHCPDWSGGARLLDYGSSAEFNYVLRRLLDPTIPGDAVLAMFGYRNSLLISSGGQPVQEPGLPDERLPDDSGDPELRRSHAWLRHLQQPLGRGVMVTVINGRTLQWAGGKEAPPQSYYDHGETLPPGLVQRLAGKCGARVVAGNVFITSPIGAGLPVASSAPEGRGQK